MNKPVYLGLSILELSKIVMYEFWYDYVKPKHVEKVSNSIYFNIFYCYFVSFRLTTSHDHTNSL